MWRYFDSMFSKLSFVQEFLKTLSWTKLAQLAVFLAIVALAWAAYESRESLYNYITRSKISANVYFVKVSKHSSDMIKNSVDKSPAIVGAQIALVDFQKNTREIVYTYTDSTELKKIYDDFEKNNAFDLPLFNADVANNRRLVKLINGEFVCVPYLETIGYRLVPDSAKYITTICSVGIPPFYGKFSGIVSIYINKTPGAEEVDQLRILAKTISTQVYEKDFR